MSENGVAETQPAAEKPAIVPPNVPMPSAEQIEAALKRLSPEQQAQIMSIGASLGGAAPPAAPAPQTVPEPPTPTRVVVEPVKAQPPGPDFPSNEPPPGYVAVPEAVYLWTAPASEGRPLWGLGVNGRKREGTNAGRLVFKLLKPSYAFTRAGKRIVVPAGGFVMMTITDALEPFLQLVNNEQGCAAFWIRALGEMPVDGGGTVFAYDVRWEQSAENPGQPRLYPRELTKR
jgi:hypothetical protein